MFPIFAKAKGTHMSVCDTFGFMEVLLTASSRIIVLAHQGTGSIIVFEACLLVS